MKYQIVPNWTIAKIAGKKVAMNDPIYGMKFNRKIIKAHKKA
jgi:hypothetical protein